MIGHAAAAGVALTLLVSATGATAQPASAPSAVVSEGAPAVKPVDAKAAGLKGEDRLVCRSVRYTGTRFPERVCKTKRQMQLDQESSQKNADTMKQRGQVTIGRGQFQ